MKILFSSVFILVLILLLIYSTLDIIPQTIPLSSCSPFYNDNKNLFYQIDGVVYPQSLPMYLNKTINFDCLNSMSTTKKILFWNPFFNDPKFSFGVGVKQPFIDNSCPVYNCETLNNRSRIDEADFVIVHMRDSIPKIPSQRPNNQRWIFTVFESPMHCPDFSKYNRQFNFTSTYRLDAEFPRLTGAYKFFEWGLNKTFDINKDFSKGKTEFAAAVIGNCGGSSKRLEYINELKKHVQVNVLGKCGIKCEEFYKNSTRDECKHLVAKNHKFYLSFENSICDGYISEKFFQILKYDVIPVVLGGGNYSHLVPKSGYINVLDFKGPKELAEYLKYLDGNKKAYNSYFKWKKYAQFKDSLWFSNFCDMCIQLNLENYVAIKKNTIENIGDYWSKKKNCKKPMFDSDKNFYLENL